MCSNVRDADIDAYTQGLEDQEDAEPERVVSIDNMTHEPIIQLYRNTAAGTPMADLWVDFLRLVQSPRGHLGLVCEWDLRPLELSFRQ